MCPNVKLCPLFSKFCCDSALTFWKSIYCESATKFETCERLKLRRSGKMPSPNMLPNGKELVC